MIHRVRIWEKNPKQREEFSSISPYTYWQGCGHNYIALPQHYYRDLLSFHLYILLVLHTYVRIDALVGPSSENWGFWVYFSNYYYDTPVCINNNTSPCTYHLVVAWYAENSTTYNYMSAPTFTTVLSNTYILLTSACWLIASAWDSLYLSWTVVPKDQRAAIEIRRAS
jgi:hypothetical protein